MLVADILRLVTKRVGTLDADVAAQLSEPELLVLLGDAVRYFRVQQVQELTPYTFDFEAFDLVDVVTPELSDPLGLILAQWMTLEVLETAYRGRLQRGEFGTAWRSGLEEESSATAARYYDGKIDRLRTELRELLLVFHREAQGARIY